jgi:hypothetical protein
VSDSPSVLFQQDPSSISQIQKFKGGGIFRPTFGLNVQTSQTLNEDDEEILSQIKTQRSE